MTQLKHVLVVSCYWGSRSKLTEMAMTKLELKLRKVFFRIENICVVNGKRKMHGLARLRESIVLVVSCYWRSPSKWMEMD